MATTVGKRRRTVSLPLTSSILPFLAAAFSFAWAPIWMVVSASGFPAGPDARGELFLPVFVAMSLAPTVAALAVSTALAGSRGLIELLGRALRVRAPASSYLVALLLVPSVAGAVIAVASTISPTFRPGILTAADPWALLAVGVAGGLAAGFLEELGWTGFAMHRMLPQIGLLRAALLLGIVHGCWHWLSGYRGEGARFGSLYLPYFLLLWILGLVALRLLIGWLYARTGTLLVAQLAHASYTGGLFLLWPGQTSAAEDLLWTGAFAVALAAVVVLIVRAFPGAPPPSRG